MFSYHKPPSWVEKLRIKRLIKKRNKLRKEGEFEQADGIRDQLNALGIIIEDEKEGTNFRLKI